MEVKKVRVEVNDSIVVNVKVKRQYKRRNEGKLT